MTFAVADDCLRLGLRAGAILFRNVEIAPALPGLRARIVEQVGAIRARFPDPAAVRSAPEVVRFQEILRRVGVNPRREQPSVERLLTFALKRGDLPAVNSLVDAYNLVSVRSFCSLGAHDLDHIEPPVTLRLLTGDESFTPLGRDAPAPVVAGEYGYVDARDRVLCRLDILQADFSKVTTESRNVLLIVEGTAEDDPEHLRQVVAEVTAEVTRSCGGTAEVIADPA
ncbi:MAG TPA: phenylalanine--tRNA ligase beta subunit-related protein [Gemmataceae bacterium]|nr:phenylalanine--tRNA ligase beta subunit-related protein [Gemmataceae bacterium]